MSLVQQKQSLRQQVQGIQQLLDEHQIDSLHKGTLQNLLADLSNDQYFVTVLGEFKRGKSTLTNALLGENILPADVTPTTATVNLLQHAEEPSVKVLHEDGTVEQHPLQTTALNKLTFLEGENFSHIHHIEIGIPFTHLNKKIMLVDTPGVGDLNEQRIDVTYSYIPRSSLVTFVIDCSTPLRRTELDYLKNHVIPNLHGELVIVANFFDRIDEEEWEEEVEEYITRKLAKVLDNVPYTLLPIAAIDNINGKSSVEFTLLKKKINELVEEGRYSKEMMEHFNERYAAVSLNIEQEIKQLTSMRQANEDDLRQAMEQIESFKKEIVQYESQLKQYLNERQEEVWAIVQKSVFFFEDRLKTLATEQIEDHPGGKFKHFIETQLPKLIQNEMNNWVSSYAQNVDILISKVENQTYSSLEQLLNQNIRNATISNLSIRFDGQFGRIGVTSKDDNGSILTGGIAAGGSVALVLLGAGLFAPVVALAGYPLLSKLVNDQKLKSAKAEALPIVIASIDEAITTLKKRIHNYIDNEFDRIETDVLQNLGIALQQNARRLEVELQLKQQKLSYAPTITIEAFEAVK